MEGQKDTYCSAGALCNPPSNLAGRIENDAFPLTKPRLRASDPDVPGVDDCLKPGSRAQHSSVEWLFWAPRTVTFSVLGLVAATVLVAMARRDVRPLEETIVVGGTVVLVGFPMCFLVLLNMLLREFSDPNKVELS